MSRSASSPKALMKHGLGHLVTRLGLHRWSLRGSVPVLAFHRVSKSSRQDALSYDPEEFRDFCVFLSRHFEVVPLSTILEILERRRVFRGELAITFDDGYRDNHDLAAPILKELNLPGTFFITTQFIGNHIIPWWDEKLGIRHEWMTWDHVRALHKMGFEIGSHTRTHVDLGTISEDLAIEEIVKSRIELEDHISAPVTLFAYPYGGIGNITEGNRELVKDAGYLCCCSCFGGLNARGTDRFRMQRIPISHWYHSPEDFVFQLAMHRV